MRRFHVVVSDQDNRYYVQPDVIDFRGKEPEFDYCLYVATLTLSLKGMNVVMAMIAEKKLPSFRE